MTYYFRAQRGLLNYHARPCRLVAQGTTSGQRLAVLVAFADGHLLVGSMTDLLAAPPDAPPRHSRKRLRGPGWRFDGTYWRWTPPARRAAA